MERSHGIMHQPQKKGRSKDSRCAGCARWKQQRHVILQRQGVVFI